MMAEHLVVGAHWSGTQTVSAGMAALLADVHQGKVPRFAEKAALLVVALAALAALVMDKQIAEKAALLEGWVEHHR